MKRHVNKVIYLLLITTIVVISVRYNKLQREQSQVSNTLQPMQQAEQITKELEPPPPVEEVNVPDTIPPRIENYCFSAAFPPLKKNEERVCIKIDSWNGYLDSTNSMPITGKIEGDIKSITVDGKKITWDENKEIYQRINLYVYGGLNKYKVVAEDINGNKSTGYVETDAQNNSNDIDVNLNQ